VQALWHKSPCQRDTAKTKRGTKMLTYNQTIDIARTIFNGAISGQNISGEACAVNILGNTEALSKLEKTGFKELIKAALPESRHSMGWLNEN